MKISDIISLHSHINYRKCPWLFLNTHTPHKQNPGRPVIILLLPPAENPCPEQGDIIQIKLSEHTEVLPKADGTGSTTMLVDTVFEMNYSTGQWTRLKKYKPITNTSWGASLAPESHIQNFLIQFKKKNMFTHTSICIHIWAKSSTWRMMDRQGEKGPPFSCTAKMQDSLKNISVLFVWLFPLPSYCFCF